MKKLLFSFLTLLLISGVTTAQEDPAKALKKATRALGAFNLDPASNDGKLEEAKNMIEIAAQDQAIAKDPKTWQTRGEVYAAYLQKDMNQLLLNPEYKPTNAKEGLKAMESFNKALDLSEKKYQTKEALKGMSETAKNLNFVGNAQIGAQNYADAYSTLKAVLDANGILEELGGEPPIAKEDVNNQKFIVAFCADVAEQKEVAGKYYKELYEAKFDEPGVYSRYFNILNAEEKSEEALKVLQEGREKFPDDTEILFAEINYYITQEKYDVLEDKLKKAVEQEPDNPSIRSAMGNVYMNLYEEEFKANGESEKAKGYFANSLDFFEQAIDLNPKQLDAIYSIGSLYFNDAVVYIKKMGDLGMSKEDQKKYDEYGAKVKDLFSKALPYFKKAEVLNPNDTNTLIALSEIFARTDQLDKSAEFKKRLQAVQAGEKNESSYFKQ